MKKTCLVLLALLFIIATLTSCATPVESVLEEPDKETLLYHATVQYGNPSIIVKDNSGPLLVYIRFPVARGFADSYILEWVHETHQNAQAKIDALRETDDSVKGELNIHFDSYLVNDRFVGIIQQGFFNNTTLINPVDIIQTFNLDLEGEVFLRNSDILDFSQIEGILSLLREKIIEAWPYAVSVLDNIDESLLEHIAIGSYGIYVIFERSIVLPESLVAINDSGGTLRIVLPYDELDFALRLGKEPADLTEEPISEQPTVYEPGPTPYVPIQSRHVDPSKPMVALTFDDGPSKYTERILDLLERHGGRATFFVVGNLVEAKSDIVQRAVYLGCEILGHSWDHRDFTKLTANEIRTQLLNTNAVIESVTGTSPRFFRPPYGAVNDTVKNVSRELGLGIVNWSIDTRDWESRNANAVYNITMRNVTNRAIILNHDVHKTTADAMERVIPDLISRGYQLVTISELMYYSGVIFEPGKIYRSGD